MSRNPDKSVPPTLGSRTKAWWHELHKPIFREPEFVGEEDYYDAPRKTYKYLRLAMLAAVAALAYSIVHEGRHAGVHCWLGSISGYYYTPVRPVFIGGMLTIGVALIVIKGTTPFADSCLSLAGLMAPIVAFIPTSDDLHGVCRPAMLAAGHYEPASATPFIGNSINNNLHSFVFAVGVAIVLTVGVHILDGRLRGPSHDERTDPSTALIPRQFGFWFNVAIGIVLVVTASILLHWGYGWVLDGHARAAVAMFGLLGVAAIATGASYLKKEKAFGGIYLVVGILMIVAGFVFVIVHAQHHSPHQVLIIEFVEIFLFVVFWAAQTIQQSLGTRNKRRGQEVTG